AGVDLIQVNELNLITNVPNVEKINNNSVSLQAYPIPFGNTLTVSYEISNFKDIDNQYLKIYNLLGQPIAVYALASAEGQIQVGEQLAPGIYLLQIGKTVKKVIKQ